MNKIFSDFLKVNARDFVKTILLGFITSVVSAVVAIIDNSGKLPSGDQWKSIATIALGAALSYVLKNFLTNSKDQFLKPE